MTEDEQEIRIRVVADDHFRKGVVTQYQFFIDKKLSFRCAWKNQPPAGFWRGPSLSGLSR